MTDQKRDPEAISPEGAGDETDTADETADETIDTADDLAAVYDELEADEGVDDAEAVDDAEPAVVAAGGRRSRDRKPKAGAPVVVPSISEQAVHIGDRASAVFVLAMVGVFVAIFGYALLFGQGGFVSNLLATPTPVVTPAPSPTAAPSAAPSVAPSAAPSVAPSVAPTPAAS